jgi:hypothetical protein
MKHTTLTAVLALLLASHGQAPAETVTTIWQEPAEARTARDLTRLAETSMFRDTMMAILANVRSLPSPAPPPKYDHYAGAFEIRYDVPDEDRLMGWTEPPMYPDGPCIIHVRPPNTVLEDEDGFWILDEIAMEQLIRHELGHCAGGVHPRGGRDNVWISASAKPKAKKPKPARPAGWLW